MRWGPTGHPTAGPALRRIPIGKALRIGVVGPAHPYRGGIAQFLAVLCSELKARNHLLACYNFTRQYPSFLFPGRSQTTDTPPAIAVSCERVLDSINPFTWLRTYRRVRSFKPDAVILSWWTPFFAPCFWSLSSLLRRLGKIPVIYVCHNIVPHEKRFVDVPLTRLALGEADFLVLLSQQSERELRDLLPAAKYAVLYHPRYSFFLKQGLARDEARARLGVKGRVLLFFGYIRPYKGLYILLEAFAEYSLKDSAASLLVVGEFYEDRAPYEETVERLGVENKVTFVDRYISDDEVALYFQACDLLVLPYLSATQSGVIQIAQSFGLPVVTTDVGGLPEVVEDGLTGFLVPPRDPGALAAAIEKFFDGSWGPKMAPHLKRAAERFSWNPLVDSITSFITAELERAEARRRGGS